MLHADGGWRHARLGGTFRPMAKCARSPPWPARHAHLKGRKTFLGQVMRQAMDIPATHEQNADQATYWNGPGGRRWVDRQSLQDVVLAPVSEVLLDRAEVAAGERAIDIGCGCGGTSIELARRVGPEGHVLGVDISEPMLARARELAPPSLSLEFVLADATVHRFEPARADLLFSRFGVMFFADPALSFVNMRKALRPNGRVVLACWREPRKNPWMILPLQEAYKHVPRLPEVGPEDPGPFAFAREEKFRRILSEAGFFFHDDGGRRSYCRSGGRSGPRGGG